MNERAALAGAQQSTQDAIPRLKQQVELAQERLARAEHELAVAERALELGTKNLQALDSTLAQVNSAVDPHAGGVTKAWQGRYGERGALTKLLLELLQSAAPLKVLGQDQLQGVSQQRANRVGPLMGLADLRHLVGETEKASLVIVSERQYTARCDCFDVGLGVAGPSQ